MANLLGLVDCGGTRLYHSAYTFNSMACFFQISFVCLVFILFICSKLIL